jgi:hypothetical protein
MGPTLKKLTGTTREPRFIITRSEMEERMACPTFDVFRGSLFPEQWSNLDRIGRGFDFRCRADE